MQFPSRRLIACIFSSVCAFSSVTTASAQTSYEQAAEPAATLKASTNLVVVDVVVSDLHGNPVKGLKQGVFSVTEDKAPQRLRAFEEHTTTLKPVVEAFPTLPPGIFTNYVPVPLNGALNVLLLDTLNTPVADQQFVRSQLLDYLKHEKPGTSLAIFGLTTRLSLLQGFTSDPEVLRSVIDHKGPRSSALLDDAAGTAAAQDSTSNQMNLVSSNPTLAYNVATFQAEQKSFQIQLRARYTLAAMNELGRYLGNFSGRKNVIWFSGSFPVSTLPDAESAGDPFAGMSSSQEEFRETTNLLAHGQIAVYPVDARGLETLPMFSAANQMPNSARNVRNFESQLADEQGTMRQLAMETGGKAFLNTNGLAQAVTKAIEAGSNYYTLSYTPTNAKQQGEYRKIRVELASSGYTLAYRQGYFSEKPETSPRRVLSLANSSSATQATAARPADTGPMELAMLHGAPGPTEIIFKLRVLPTSRETEDHAAEGNALAQSPKADAKPTARPPYRRYSVDFAASPQDIRFTPIAENKLHANVEFVTLVLDRDGNLVNSITNTVLANLTPERYKSMLRGGVQFHQEISVPEKGVYTLRVGVHDLTSGHIGATELAIADVKTLAPVVAPAQPAAAPAEH